MHRYLFCSALLLALVGCSSEKAPEPKAPEPAAKKEPEAPPAAAKVPATFKVKFETTKGVFIVEVTRDWAPIGAERFYELVQDKFFDGAGFFRVVPNFVVQFGLAADPAQTKRWSKEIKDDPVIRTNRAGTLVFATAGPNTRTTQLFINLKSNQMLDDQGFAPFAAVVQGMDVVDSLYKGYGERPDQGAITAQGNAYLKAQFPNLDFIKTARVM
jgi:peptidyl-prolyl cis-trans isomerase A (cyclophilin A)